MNKEKVFTIFGYMFKFYIFSQILIFLIRLFNIDYMKDINFIDIYKTMMICIILLLVERLFIYFKQL